MTETETAQSGAASGASAPVARKKSAGKRSPRKKSPALGSKRSRGTVRKKAVAGARKTARKGKSGLDALVQGLAKKASEARGLVKGFSEEQAVAARRAAGKVAASSKKTIARVKKEWNGMDNTRKATFVAALLGALAAASGSIVAGKKK